MYTVNFPPQTNQATFNPIIEIKDQDTDELLDLSDIDIVFEIRDDSDCCILKATKDDKIVLIDTGYFQPTFDPSDLSRFRSGTYRVHCRFTREGTTRDVMIGSLPVVCP